MRNHAAIDGDAPGQRADAVIARELFDPLRKRRSPTLVPRRDCRWIFCAAEHAQAQRSGAGLDDSAVPNASLDIQSKDREAGGRNGSSRTAQVKHCQRGIGDGDAFGERRDRGIVVVGRGDIPLEDKGSASRFRCRFGQWGWPRRRCFGR